MSRSDFRRLSFLLLLAAFFLIAAPSSQAQSGASLILIHDVNADAFPGVQVRIQALDINGNLVNNITPESLLVLEGSEPVSSFQIAPGEPVPVHTVFVIDLGNFAQYQNYDIEALRELLRDFNSFFLEGQDTVSIIERRVTNPSDLQTDQSITVLPPTQSGDAFLSAVDGLTFAQTGRTQGLLGVEDALGEVQAQLSEQPGRSAIVFISHSIHWPVQSEARQQAQNLSAAAFSQHAVIHSLHAHPGGQLGEPLQALAERSGGLYVRLATNTSNRAAVREVYEAIRGLQQSLTVSYRSTQSNSGSRQVVVAPANVPDAVSAENSASYSVDLAAPQIGITNPTDGARVVRADEPGTEEVALAPDSLVIEAQVADWPDNHPRQISQVELLQDGTVIDTLSNPGDGPFRFTLDLSGVNETASLPIQVRVTDELGLTAESQLHTIQVQVEPLRFPTETPAATATPEPTPIPAPVVDPCEVNPLTVDCLTNLGDRSMLLVAAVLGVLGIGLLLLTILVIFFWRRRNKKKTRGATSGSKRGEAVSETIVWRPDQAASSDAIARLHVLNAQPDLVGMVKDITSYKTTMGRDPNLCDVQLYTGDQQSSVSGVHCTIQYDPNQQRFLLTDDNSTNGTRLNGRRIQANDPVPLADGDEIILGDPFRSGAKVRFEIARTSPMARQRRSSQSESVLETLIDPTGEDAPIERDYDRDEEKWLGDETVIDIDEDEFDLGTPEDDDNDDWMSGLE